MDLPDRPDTPTRLRVLLDRADQLGYSLSRIERATGVSRSWLSAFRLGKIPHPTSKNLDKLFPFLESLTERIDEC